MEFVGEYQFNTGETISVWKTPKFYRAVVYMLTSDSIKPVSRKVFQSDSFKDAISKAWPFFKKNLKSRPVLRESDGPKFPLETRTEEEEIKQFSMNFIATQMQPKVGRPLPMVIEGPAHPSSILDKVVFDPTINRN